MFKPYIPNIKSKIDPNDEPLFYVKSLPKIKYSKKPPLLGGEYEEIPTQTFAQSKGFKWNDAMLANKKVRDAIWKEHLSTNKAISYIEERLHHPLENLIISFMNDAVGHGVFLDKQGDSLALATLVHIYSGNIVPFTLGNTPYLMRLNTEDHGKCVVDNFLPHSEVDSEQNGNIVRFMQDMPTEKELAAVKNLTPLELSNIMTENVAVYPMLYCGCPIVIVFTNREIKPGEQLGFSYENSIGGYLGTQKRCVFNKVGEVIGHFTSTNTIKLDPNYKPTPEMAVTRTNTSEAAGPVKSLLLTPKVNTFNFEERLQKNLDYTLAIYCNRFEKNSPEVEVITSMQKDLALATNAQEKIIALNKAFILDKYSSLFKTSLKDLRAELAFHMKNYYDGLKNRMTDSKNTVKPTLDLQMK